MLAGGALVAAALLWDSAALLAIPGVFVAALFFSLGDSETWALVRLARETGPLSLPDPERFTEAAAKEMLRRLASARGQLAQAVGVGAKGEGSLFGRASRHIRTIEGRVIVSAARVEYLGQLLSTSSASDVERDLERLRCLEARALVPATRDEYQAAIAVYEGRLAVVRQVGSQREWLLASADRMLCTLESLPARVVHIQCSRLLLGDQDECGTLDGIDELRVFLEALEEAFTVKDEVASSRRNGALLRLKIPSEIDRGAAPVGDRSNLEDDEACVGSDCDREGSIDS